MRSPRQTAASYTRGDTALLVAGGYAALVVAVAAWLGTLSAAGDAGLGGVWLIALTLPVSIPLLAIPASPAAYVAMLAAGGLAQAWVVWRLLRGRRAR
ncbi:SCO4225 family membrane protein [Streptomyces cinereospinus]|uniref:SCO4225 family membrane protein n=1 Tax=Streptomyces cinereospinus TaxID=285561 RepID=A0ABV5N367_9ACTN